MDEHLSRILSVLSDGSVPPAAQDVEAVTKRYDFFYLPAVLALRHGAGSMDAGLRQRLIEQIAMNCPDLRMGFMLTDVAYEEWAHFYPACRAEVNTSDAISKFLETYGRYDPREEALLERLIFNPAPDYSSMLAREEESDLPTVADAATADNPQDALINSFILKHKDDESQLLPRSSPGMVTRMPRGARRSLSRLRSIMRRAMPRARHMIRHLVRALRKSISARRDMTKRLKLFTL